MDINLNRYNKVIVNKGFTDEYHVEDGIDQGEVWSPLLWRIFYDTLLTRLEKIKEEVGYTMEATRMIDIKNNQVGKLKMTFNVSAFIDDTTLISKNKSSLEKIKANIGKYELIKINNEQEEDLKIKNEIIKKVNNEEGNRFPGIWFRYDNRRKTYKKKIKNIIDQACKLFSWKQLNEKQIIATWNIVIIPRIEHQLQVIVRSKEECTTLMQRINKLVKQKSELAISTPNFTLYDKDIYGLKNIYDLQIESLCKNLLYEANDNDRIKTIFKIKMIQEQNQIWTASCIGNLEAKGFKTYNSWIINAINILKNKDIMDIIKSANSRKTKKVLFLEQLLEQDNLKMLKWKHFYIENNLNTKGKIPKWFTKIKNEITIQDTRDLKSKYMNKNLPQNREYRQWRKRCTDAIWKNEILNSKKLEDLFIFNFKNEFDWGYSLQFLSNKNKFDKNQCGKQDAHDRSCKIKNLLKDLPTYKTLQDRKVNSIDTAQCPRCEKYEEDWEHIWICENNEFSIRDIIEEAIYDYETLLKREERTEEVNLIQEYNFNFINILYEKSLILTDRTREWEMIR
ncbi:hypothetical protein GLOIN_2v1817843 [Rhizophagus clarus]|uniref:Reverse transcriptase domain-containing protein n=1 Tax=Rhizophagus clarus TaxID=94130 RepID=A0A8H3L217_9GLOM|nr:hypothetical protein GLOIN_2v1817843 [Rhizophagus clarus]